MTREPCFQWGAPLAVLGAVLLAVAFIIPGDQLVPAFFGGVALGTGASWIFVAWYGSRPLT